MIFFAGGSRYQGILATTSTKKTMFIKFYLLDWLSFIIKIVVPQDEKEKYTVPVIVTKHIPCDQIAPIKGSVGLFHVTNPTNQRKRGFISCDQIALIKYNLCSPIQSFLWARNGRSRFQQFMSQKLPCFEVFVFLKVR